MKKTRLGTKVTDMREFNRICDEQKPEVKREYSAVDEVDLKTSQWPKSKGPANLDSIVAEIKRRFKKGL